MKKSICAQIKDKILVLAGIAALASSCGDPRICTVPDGVYIQLLDPTETAVCRSTCPDRVIRESPGWVDDAYRLLDQDYGWFSPIRSPDGGCRYIRPNGLYDDERFTVKTKIIPPLGPTIALKFELCDRDDSVCCRIDGKLELLYE